MLKHTFCRSRKMKNLNKLDEPPAYISYLSNIINAKRDAVVKTELTAQLSAISFRYAALVDALNADTLHAVYTDVNMKRNSAILRSCYENRTKILNVLLVAIRNKQTSIMQGLCPYCGMTIPKTYDHYLPASDYPEYSVHPLNLVPCCSTCNQKKNNYWVAAGKRLFIHFYHDMIPETKFLEATIIENPTTNAVGANFKLSRPDGIDDCIWEIIEAHYDRLELLKLYNENANSEIAELQNICISCWKNYGGDKRRLKRFIKAIIDGKALLCGENNWKIALYRGLIKSQKFINSITS